MRQAACRHYFVLAAELRVLIVDEITTFLLFHVGI